jgi:hypothetical protein
VANIKQDTANKAVNTKYVKIIHPYHPLKGKCYTVVRNMRQASQDGGSWVIKLENGQRMCVPYDCGELVADHNDSEGPTTMGDNELWAALPHLQALKRLVEKLKEAAQGASHEHPSDEIEGKTGNPARMGTDPQSPTTRDDPDSERNDLATGGER